MGRPFNAEEAVLPLRTVVILVCGLFSLTVAAVTVTNIATGQWDQTQHAIQTTQAKIDTLSTDQAAFRSEIAKLIVVKGGERDAQFAKVNASMADLGASLTASVADLNTKIAQLKQNQDGSIGQIRLQIENIMRDMSVMKCKLPGNDCAKVKP